MEKLRDVDGTVSGLPSVLSVVHSHDVERQFFTRVMLVLPPSGRFYSDHAIVTIQSLHAGKGPVYFEAGASLCVISVPATRTFVQGSAKL